jgi:hypothetical protein
MSRKRVPESAQGNVQRIQSRPYEDFATFPADEVHSERRPGAGPRGAIDDGPRPPVVVMAVGALLVFLALILGTPWPIAAGVLLVIVGGVWSGLTRSRS